MFLCIYSGVLPFQTVIYRRFRKSRHQTWVQWIYLAWIKRLYISLYHSSWRYRLCSNVVKSIMDRTQFHGSTYCQILCLQHEESGTSLDAVSAEICGKQGHESRLWLFQQKSTSIFKSPVLIIMKIIILKSYLWHLSVSKDNRILRNAS